MTEWWNELGMLKQIFYTIAVPATIILVIQSIMSIIGLSDFDIDLDGVDTDGFDGLDGIDDLDVMDISDTSGDSDFDGDFRFFTIRGMIAFFTIFGWSGAALAGHIHPVAVIVIALASGLLAMLIIGYLFYGMTLLQSNGNIRYENCIDKVGEVYLTIPPNKQGKGKVTVKVQERLTEVNAITYDEKPIKSGDNIKVVDILPDHTVIVERI
jgi:hypothetical protein